MTPMELAMAVNTAKGLYQAGVGVWQGIQGNGINDNRPQAFVPESQKKALEMQNTLRMGHMPGMDLTKVRLDQNLARASRKLASGATTSSQLMEGLTTLYSNTNDNLLDLGIKDASWRTDMNALYGAGLEKLADREWEVWDWNQKQAYQDNMAAKGALGYGAINNVGGALDTFLGGQLTNALGPKSTVAPGTQTGVGVGAGAGTQNGMQAPGQEKSFDPTLTDINIEARNAELGMGPQAPALQQRELGNPYNPNTFQEPVPPAAAPQQPAVESYNAMNDEMGYSALEANKLTSKIMPIIENSLFTPVGDNNIMTSAATPNSKNATEITGLPDNLMNYLNGARQARAYFKRLLHQTYAGQ